MATRYRSRKNGGKSRKKRPNKKARRRFLVIGLPLIILILLILAFFTGNKSLFTLYSLQRERNQLRQQKEQLRLEQIRLKDEIEKFKIKKEPTPEDIRRIEEIAREKYNLKKDKEEVYIAEPK